MVEGPLSDDRVKVEAQIACCAVGASLINRSTCAKLSHYFAQTPRLGAELHEQANVHSLLKTEN